MSESRFSNWAAKHLALLVTAIAVLMLYGVTLSAPKVAPLHKPQTGLAANVPANDDLRLYAEINKRVASGENYYEAVAKEHRFNHYPLKPFFVVRLPTLATISAFMGPTAMRVLGFALILTTCFVWWRKLSLDGENTQQRNLTIILLFAGVMPLMRADIIGLHEVWAGGLIALSAGLWRKDNVLPAVLAATAALAIRETALPFLLLMGAAALWGKQWREFLYWALPVALLLAVVALHAKAVSQIVLSDDLASPGWSSAGGWATYLNFVQQTSVLRVLPMWLSAIIVPLSLLGLASRTDRLSTMILLFQLGFALVFMVVGRPDNFYWGFLVAPTLLIGLAYARTTISVIWSKLRPAQSMPEGERQAG